jgi:Transposase DNA-binding/Transposase Tn5 dimerisation domain
MSWAGEELAEAELGDTRRVLRLMRMVESLADHAERSIPQSFDSEAEVKAAYRFWENEAIGWREILAPHSRKTVRRAMDHPVVLVAQDTTEINLTTHPATAGLGYLASTHSRGVLLHSCLAISPQGVPLGIVDQQVWTRPVEQLGQRHQRRKKATADKESQRWLNGVQACQTALAKHPRVIVIGDRESDIYELFAAARAPHVHLLVRVAHEKRRVEHPARYLGDALATAPVLGQIEVAVPRKQNRPSRRARLNVRVMTLAIQAPHNRPGPAIPLQFLLVEEVDPPVGEAPIHWLLATTLPVETLENATQCVQWYVFRWRIERFHFTLKSGYQVEERQFEGVENVERALATFSIVAWRVLWLMLTAREQPDGPATIVLAPDEWRALYAATHRRGKLHAPLPLEPPTLGAAVLMLGRLGGHLGRKRDRQPGVKTIWRGITRLHDITIGWRIAHAPP